MVGAGRWKWAQTSAAMAARSEALMGAPRIPAKASAFPLVNFAALGVNDLAGGVGLGGQEVSDVRFEVIWYCDCGHCFDLLTS
jgi:hypothetical protein